MSGLLRDIRRINRVGNLDLAEPFAGGAGASLGMLFMEEAPAIHVNDADPAIHDFWWALLNRSSEFARHIDETPLNIGEWTRQRATYRRTGRTSRFRRGFAAFYLNRCNRSGIVMNGGPIGGIEQKGKWRIDARFNREDLKRRCQRVGQYRDRISLTSEDGIAFIDRLKDSPVFFFVDPPYFHKGASLYLNGLNADYHENLASKLHALQHLPWALTYDDCPEIRQMYKGWASIRSFALRYTASSTRQGREIMITPKWMRLPSSQSSASILW